MRVLVCGSRHWRDYALIERTLAALPDVTCVIHGDAPGADQLADLAADVLSLPVLRFPADWQTHGKAAGPLRNQRMLVEGAPDLVLAFHPCLAQSRGTKDMIARARRAGVPVRLIAGREEEPSP